MTPVAPDPHAARRAFALGAAVFVGGAALLFAASRATGPTFEELARISTATRAHLFARALSDFGPSATVSSSARTIYDELAPFGLIPALISGSVGDALSRLGLLDKLTGVRLGWLLVTMTAPFSLFMIVRPSRGVRSAALSACMLVALPRWTHAAAVASESAFVVSLWLLAIACYVRSLPPPIARRKAGVSPRNRAAGAMFAVVLGFGVATNLATLWVVPLIAAHYFALRGRGSVRALRRGIAPVPAAALWALFLSPAVVLLLNPKLWRGGAVSAAEWLFLPLAPSLAAVTYKGVTVTADTVPAGYAASFLVSTVPVLIALAAMAGGVVMFIEFRGARRGRRDHDPVGLGSLVLLGVLAVAVGPAFEPRVFLRFPPRVEAALPWIAIACAVGIDGLAVRLYGERKAVWHVVAAAVVFMAVGLVRLPTASASFSLLAGGTRGAIAGKTWAIGDGSEVSVFARAIDDLRLPAVSLQSSEVPKNYFAVLSTMGRLRTKVDLSTGAGDLVLSRGPRRGALATADQGGATLWSLTRRR